MGILRVKRELINKKAVTSGGPVAILKWYYDGNRIFPIEAILKQKQVVCMRRKMPFIQVFKICQLTE